MDMRQLRQFIAVAEHGNVRRAADVIHLSQPALTKSIHNLEEELGVQLLTRGPRGVALTIYGEILLRHARPLRNAGETAVAEIQAVKAGQVGHLRLGVANFSISFLPRVIAQLLAIRPGLSFEIVDGTYEGLTALVREGVLDAVASGFPMVHRAEDLVHEELVAGEFLMACRRDHPVLAHKQISLTLLAQQRWIMANRPQQIIEFLEFMCRTTGVTPPKPMITSGSMSFLKAVLLEGEFLTALPRCVLRQELEAGTLVTVPYAGAPVRTAEGVIYRADAVHPPALFVLIEAIKAENAADEVKPARQFAPHAQKVPPTRNVTTRARRSGRDGTRKTRS
ncbi:MAG TPA: LysR family transcriptional regulator [Polyangiales bacterium]